MFGIGVFAGVLMIPADWNYFIGYAVGTAIAVIGLYIAFILPVWLRWRLGDKLDEPGPGASAGTTSGSTPFASSGSRSSRSCSSSRSTTRAPVGGRLQLGVHELHDPLVRRASASFFGGWWVLSAKNWFKGPVRMGTEEELERLEEEQLARFELPTESGA